MAKRRKYSLEFKSKLVLELLKETKTPDRTPYGRRQGLHGRSDRCILPQSRWNRKPDPGLIHHSGHGSQYTSLALGQALRHSGILGSMGTVGDAFDNAVAESFFANLQTELLDRHTWSTRRELMLAIFEYVEGFYNRRRRRSTLGYLSPEEFERRWRASQRKSERSVA